MSAHLGDHDYGVSESAARPGRPAYFVGDSVSLEIGLGGLIKPSDSWYVAINFAVDFLADEITDSPIVDDDGVIKGFAALAYCFFIKIP